MKFTFRGFAVAMAAVLVASLPMTALAQKDDKKRSKQEKEEIETIVKMTDAAMAGQPAPTDVTMKIRLRPELMQLLRVKSMIR